MAISIDWATKIITVPKADTTLVQSSPIEIRELNLNSFRLALKDLEDDPEGMSFLDTHTHNSEVLLGGIVYARVLEIINGYTVTFEDGAYALNLVGANSNVGDVINFNQVSVRSANAAGLISNSAIEYASFNGGVTIDVNSSNTGTIFPTGTPQQPVNNVPDAVLIATFRGFTRLYINDDITLDTGDIVDDLILIGDSTTNTQITVNPGASTVNSQFYECTLTGTLDGGSTVSNSIISNLNFVDGIISNCMINPGTITLSGVNTAHFLDCKSGVPGESTPIIDMDGSGSALAMRNYNGGIKIINKTGTDAVSIDINSGQIILDSTVTTGTIVARGVGTIDNGAGAAVIINDSGLINKDNIALASSIQNGLAQGAGNGLNQIQFDTSASATDGAYDPAMVVLRNGTGAGQTRIIYEYNGTTKIATVDRNWKIQPDTTTEYAIMPNASREHVNEGLAQAGSISTITLNTNASSANDAYVGQIVFLRSGTGDDQARVITAYNGTTKIATVDTNWSVNPNNTTGYAILPYLSSGGGGSSPWTTQEKLDLIAESAETNVFAKKASEEAEQVNIKIT